MKKKMNFSELDDSDESGIEKILMAVDRLETIKNVKFTVDFVN